MSSAPKARVLICDDEPQICQMLVTLFHMEGYFVHSATDGYLGLHYYWEMKPDLIITDLEMPSLDGVDFILEVRKVDPNTPILVMTGHDMKRVSELDDANIAGVVPKPCTPVELLGAVQNILAKPIDTVEPKRKRPLGIKNRPSPSMRLWADKIARDRHKMTQTKQVEILKSSLRL